MAYEYNLSPIDIDGAIKAVQDNAFRQEQLRLKYEESMNKAIDDQQRLYNGKVRQQDIGEFDSVFAEYAEAQKRYQSLNKFGRRGGDLTKASADARTAKAKMDSYITDSTSLGQTHVALGKIFKDPTKLVNTKKYNEVYMQLSSMTTKQIKDLYAGDLKKLPTDFEFKEEDFNIDKVTKFSKAVQGRLPVRAQDAIKDFPAIDPTTGKQKTKLSEISGMGKTMKVEVPLVTVRVGFPPSSVLNAVISATADDDDAENYMKLYQKKVNARAADTSNPQVQKEAEELIKKTMDVFGITDRSMVNHYHLFASDYIDQKRIGDIEIEDWSGLEKHMNLLLKQNRMELTNAQKEKLKNDILEQNQGLSLKTFTQLVTLYKSLRDTGLLSNEDWKLRTIELYKKYNLPMSKEIMTSSDLEIINQAKKLSDAAYPGRVPPEEDR